MRRFVLARGLLDYPNSRSSHVVPTPRGGGLAMVTAVLGSILALVALDALPGRTGIGIGGGAALVAAVGWLDDRHGLAASVRAAVHAVAAVWTVWWLGGVPPLSLRVIEIPASLAGLLAVVALIWLTNLYNFMDGIDGLAAGEAVLVGAFGAGLLAAAGRPGLAGLAFAVSGASVGFLVWNWWPARIFMGDVGSGFLGFVVGGLALASVNAGGPGVLDWAVLLGVFLVDSTITLARRIWNREPWYAAHRTHAYQRLVSGGWSHSGVTVAELCLTAVAGLIVVWAHHNPTRRSFALALGGSLPLLAYWAVERRFPRVPD